MITDRFAGGTRRGGQGHAERRLGHVDGAVAAPVPPGEETLSELSVSAEELPDLIRLRLIGHLDVYTAQVFNDYAWRYEPEETQLVVDLTRVLLIDSTGLASLMLLRDRARARGARIGIVCPNVELVRLFWCTGTLPAFAFGERLSMVRATLAAEPPRGRPGTP